MNYIGLDIHKKSISCYVRQPDGTIMQEGTITAMRDAPDNWMRQLPRPWMTGVEATLFTGWIYDHLVAGGTLVKVAPARPPLPVSGSAPPQKPMPRGITR